MNGMGKIKNITSLICAVTLDNQGTAVNCVQLKLSEANGSLTLKLLSEH
jgi:hypothetical protein